jgi:glycosyltransferase involved in cell wall biosynthesis
MGVLDECEGIAVTKARYTDSPSPLTGLGVSRILTPKRRNELQPGNPTISAAPATVEIPVVSVVVAVLNEVERIEDLVRSILAQDLAEPFELVLVDGMSTDGTREKLRKIIAEVAVPNRCVRLLDNPKQRTPYAFNIGLHEAQGEFFALFGAHASYEPSYLRTCVEAIRATSDRVAVGGMVRTVPSNSSLPCRLVVDVLTSEFASSKSSFRTQVSGSVDNLAFPVVRRSELIAAGGYDERLLRNQDNEMNGRLRQSGMKLELTDQTSASYFPASTPKKLIRYARRNGWWNAKTVALGLNGLRFRHFVPAAFAFGIATTTVSALIGTQTTRRLSQLALVSALGTHLAVGTSLALKSEGQTTGAERLLLAPLTTAFHLAYGLGTISYLAKTSEPVTTN